MGQWVKAQPPPGVFTHPIRRFKDRSRFLFGRKSNTNFVRWFPNPGFMFTFRGLEVKYSVHRGFSKRKKF